MTTEEVAEKSGLAPAVVVAISSQLNWDGVELKTARAFMQGCGMDLSDPLHVRRLRDYLRWASRRPPHCRFGFIKRSSEHAYLDELWLKWRKFISTNDAAGRIQSAQTAKD